MKILFPIGTLYPSQQGGPSNTVYWMAKALVSQGVQVTIVTTNHGAEKQVEGDRWLDTNYGRVIYHTFRILVFPFKMVRSTIHCMPQCDVVHLTSLFYPPSLIAALSARWYDKPILWSPRGELDTLALVYSTWKKKPVLWLIRLLFSKKAVFHSTSPGESERIKAVLGQSVQVVEIPNFLELPPISPRNQTASPYLLCIGRIHPKKAIEHLISALPLSQKFMESDLKLVIAGDDHNAHGEQLKKQVNHLNLLHKVEFSGHIEGAAKQALFANAWFSILPSHTENFGNVVVESLAQGTPVIASTGTPWSMLTEEQAGFWSDNTPVTLARSIDQAMGLSSEQYQTYRNNALNLVRQRFDIQQNIGAWIATYQKAIIN